jgi:hypothetical protein
MCKELEELVHRSAARLIYLPTYAPQVNPIQEGFVLLKQWLNLHVDLCFPICPELVLDANYVLLEDNGRDFFRSFWLR